MFAIHAARDIRVELRPLLAFPIIQARNAYAIVG